MNNRPEPRRWNMPSGRCGSTKSSSQGGPSLLCSVCYRIPSATDSLRFFPSSSASGQNQASRPQPFCLALRFDGRLYWPILAEKGKPASRPPCILDYFFACVCVCVCWEHLSADLSSVYFLPVLVLPTSSLFFPLPSWPRTLDILRVYPICPIALPCWSAVRLLVRTCTHACWQPRGLEAITTTNIPRRATTLSLTSTSARTSAKTDPVSASFLRPNCDKTHHRRSIAQYFTGDFGFDTVIAAHLVTSSSSYRGTCHLFVIQPPSS